MLRRRPAALSGGGGGRGGGRGPRSAASPPPHGPRRGGASRGHRLGGAAASGAGWEESLPGAAGAFGGRFGAGLPRAAAAAAKFARTTGGERGGAGRNGGQWRGGGCTAHPGGRGLRGVRGERRWRAVPGELRRSRHRGRPSALAVSSAGVCRGVSAPPPRCPSSARCPGRSPRVPYGCILTWERFFARNHPPYSISTAAGTLLY